MSPVRAGLAVVVVAAMGCAILGIGMGEAPAEREPAPSAAAVRASQQRIAAGGETVRAGQRLFAEQGCDRCHAIAATGAHGSLGPRLDTLDADLGDNLESIEEPRDDVAHSYPERLMPADFGQRLDDGDLLALGLFVTAASGGEAEPEATEEDVDGGRRGGGGGSGEG